MSGQSGEEPGSEVGQAVDEESGAGPQSELEVAGDQADQGSHAVIN